MEREVVKGTKLQEELNKYRKTAGAGAAFCGAAGALLGVIAGGPIGAAIGGAIGGGIGGYFGAKLGRED